MKTIKETNQQPNKVFPAFNSMEDLMAYAKSLLPITDPNVLHTLVQITRNTVLNQK